LSRLWLDNVTATAFSMVPQGNGVVQINNTNLQCGAGSYLFTESFNYPQLEQAQEVLNAASQQLIA
jgi:hypothetical protein